MLVLTSLIAIFRTGESETVRSLEAALHTGLVIGLAAPADRVRSASVGRARRLAALPSVAAVGGARRTRDGRRGGRRRRRHGYRRRRRVGLHARRDGRRRGVRARGARHDQVELSVFGTWTGSEIQSGTRHVSTHEGANATSRVFGSITRLAVGVRAQPLTPARLAMRRRDGEIEVESIAMFESDVALVDRLHAGAARRRD